MTEAKLGFMEGKIKNFCGIGKEQIRVKWDLGKLKIN